MSAPISVGCRVEDRMGSGKQGSVKNLYLMQGKVRVHWDGEENSVTVYRGELRRIEP